MFPEHRNFALMPMCLLGQTGTTGEKAAVCSQPWLETGSLDCVVDACVAWIPRGSSGSLSKHGHLGGSPGMVVGCLGVAGTRQMALHKSAGLSLEEKGRGLGFKQERVNCRYLSPSVSRSRGLGAGGVVPGDLQSLPGPPAGSIESCPLD